MYYGRKINADASFRAKAAMPVRAAGIGNISRTDEPRIDDGNNYVGQDTSTRIIAC